MGSTPGRFSFARARLTSEMRSMDIPPGMELTEWCTSSCSGLFYKISVQVSSGPYRDHIVEFVIEVPEEYPFVSPKVLCLTKIYHPNIDNDGHTCLEVLKHKWTSSMGIQHILYGLHQILTNPSGNDALNVEAGDVLERSYDEFLKMIKKVFDAGASNVKVAHYPELSEK